MPVSRKKLIRQFRKMGFIGPLSGGRHQFMVKGELKVRIPNLHGSADISDSLLGEILRQAGISKQEWDQK